MTLYLISTPIGNLADISFRAIDTLKACDYLLCEDTRHSLILLKHYNIQKPLKSYHKFNESFRAESILDDLKEGKNIGLISDAGTPGISDPGADLVKLCVESRLPVIAIPGPCAAIQALICSGLPTDRFQFWGFLSRKESDLQKELKNILCYPGTTIAYESPHRLLKVLKVLESLDPSRPLVIARELTKKFEEILHGTASFLLKRWEKEPPKGEIVLLIAPSSQAQILDWSSWTPEEHVEWMQRTYGLEQKEAIKTVAQLRGVPKRNIYQSIHTKDLPFP